MSFTETLVILVVAMIVLGPKKLPSAARRISPSGSALCSSAGTSFNEAAKQKR